MATFGVTTASIEATANGMTFSTMSRPTTAQVTTWIGQCGARAAAAIRAAGADPTSVEIDADGEGYLLAQQYVTMATAALAVSARDRADSELARTYREQAAGILTDLRTIAAALGDQRSTAEQAPGLAWAPVQYADDQQPTADARFWGSTSGQI